MPVSTSSQTTAVELDADRQIQNGESIRLDDIVIANGSGGGVLVEIRDGADTATIAWIACPSGDQESLGRSSIQSGGVLIKSAGSSDVKATVFHSYGGA